MKLLVTGGNGFLGAAVARALVARGDAVVVFDNRAAGGAVRGRSEIVGDIADAGAVARALRDHRPDGVIHCAAIVGVLPSLGHPAGVVRVNIEGALNVFEAMRHAGVKRCIHISSEEVYGPFQADRIDEAHVVEPVLPYGICKAAVERLGRSYRDMYGLDVIHLRTSWVYGPGLPRDRVPKNMIESALARRPLHLPSGASSAIDHTYVDDAVSAVLAAFDHRVHSYDVYNVASGSAVTIAAIAEIVRELLPGAVLTVGPGPYRHGDRIDVVRKGALDVARAAREFGWRPQYDIRSGLAAYVKTMQADRSAAEQ